MIELVQMIGKDSAGKRHIFNVDTVFKVMDGVRQKVGFVNRKDGARFSCIKRMTDDELDKLVEEINEARKVQGRFGPVTHPRMLPPSQESLAAYVAENSEDDEDDDFDD